MHISIRTAFRTLTIVAMVSSAACMGSATANAQSEKKDGGAPPPTQQQPAVGPVPRGAPPAAQGGGMVQRGNAERMPRSDRGGAGMQQRQPRARPEAARPRMQQQPSSRAQSRTPRLRNQPAQSRHNLRKVPRKARPAQRNMRKDQRGLRNSRRGVRSHAERPTFMFLGGNRIVVRQYGPGWCRGLHRGYHRAPRIGWHSRNHRGLYRC